VQWQGQRPEGAATLNNSADCAIGDELEVLRVESNVLVVRPIKQNQI
jgi:hypothetical protein